MDSFKKRFCAMQFELKAPKNQRNSFGNYNYRSCEDIVEATKPVFQKYSLGLNITDEIVTAGGKNYIKATATVFDQESEETKSSCGYAREPESKKGMDDSQLTGATSSYARKYALNGVLGIDDTKDADTDAYSKQSKKNDAADIPIYCDKCGIEMKDSTHTDGSPWPLNEVITFSQGRFNGKIYCKDCMTGFLRK